MATKRSKTSWISSSKLRRSLFLVDGFLLFFSRACIARRSVRGSRYSRFSSNSRLGRPCLRSSARKPMAPVCQGASRRRQPFVKGITLSPFSLPRNIKIPTYLRRAWRVNRLRCTYFSHVCTVARGRDFFVPSENTPPPMHISLSRGTRYNQVLIKHLLRTLTFDYPILLRAIKFLRQNAHQVLGIVTLPVSK